MEQHSDGVFQVSCSSFHQFPYHWSVFLYCQLIDLWIIKSNSSFYSLPPVTETLKHQSVMPSQSEWAEDIWTSKFQLTPFSKENFMWLLPFQGGIRNVCVTIEDFQRLNWCRYFVREVWGCRYGSHTKQFIFPNPPAWQEHQILPRESLSNWQEDLRSSCTTSVSVMIVLITTAAQSV